MWPSCLWTKLANQKTLPFLFASQKQTSSPSFQAAPLANSTFFFLARQTKFLHGTVSGAFSRFAPLLMMSREWGVGGRLAVSVHAGDTKQGGQGGFTVVAQNAQLNRNH